MSSSLGSVYSDSCWKSPWLYSFLFFHVVVVIVENCLRFSTIALRFSLYRRYNNNISISINIFIFINIYIYIKVLSGFF